MEAAADAIPGSFGDLTHTQLAGWQVASSQRPLSTATTDALNIIPLQCRWGRV